MIKHCLVVCPVSEITDSIQNWLGRAFDYHEFQSYAYIPMNNHRESSKLLGMSVKCDAAIFWNVSGIYEFKGSKALMELCEEYTVNNPDCIVNYHFSDQRFLRPRLELLRKEFPLLHFKASFEPGDVVKDLVDMVQKHDLQLFKETISSRNKPTRVSKKLYGTPAD